MDSQVSGFRQKFKANRFASTLVVLATLTLGILIGTVVSGGVKGKEKNSSADATPLQVPSPVTDVERVFPDRSRRWSHR